MCMSTNRSCLLNMSNKEMWTTVKQDGAAQIVYQGRSISSISQVDIDDMPRGAEHPKWRTKV
jgi:hypothetical protein